MTTIHLEFTGLDKKQLKVLMGFLTKMKRIYKEGFYIVNAKYLYPDTLSIAELLGEYTVILNDKITHLLKMIGLNGQVVYIKDAALLTTKITDLEIEVPEDHEETEWLKGYYEYMTSIDNYKKKGIPLVSANTMIEGDRDDWLERYVDSRQTLLYDKDDIKFYHSSRMFPFLTVKNFDNLYFSACNRDDNYTGEMIFVHEIDEFKIEAHFFFLVLK